VGPLFLIFWLWVMAAGFKAVWRRLAHAVSWFGSDTLDYRTVEPSRAVRLVPPLAATGTQIWTPDERRSFGRKLDSVQPVDGGKIIGEMQQQLTRLTAHAAEVERNLAKWEAELGRIDAAQADWTERATLAVDKGREALARAALEQRQKLDARKVALKADMARLEALLATYYKDIAVLEQKTSDSIRLAVVASSRLEGAEDSARARELVFGERTAAALSNLEQVERAADLAEGRAEALTLGAPRNLEDEFAALKREAELDRALGEIKAKRARSA